MHQTPARTPRRPRAQEPDPADRDLLGMAVRGTLAAALGCGGAGILLVLLAVIFSLLFG